MVTFEGIERRIGQIEPFLKENGFNCLEDARELCLERGVDVESIVKGVQTIAFENAVWAYTLGAALAGVGRVRGAGVWVPGIGDGGDHHASHAHAAAVVVLGGLPHDVDVDRRLCRLAPASPGAISVRDGVVDAPQAAARDGRRRTDETVRAGRGR